MRWFITTTRHWWKNLSNINRKYRYIDILLISSISSFLIFILILRIEIILISLALIMICIFNFFNIKFWITFFIFSSIIFLSYVVYQSIFAKIDGIKLDNDLNMIREYKAYLIFKYKDAYFKVFKTKSIIDITFMNNYEYTFHIKGTLILNKNLSSFEAANRLFFNLTNSNIEFIKKNEKLSIFNTKNRTVIDYLNIIIFNNYNQANNIYKKLSDLNIIHFFTISGFHFNLIYLFISKIIRRIKNGYFVEDFIAIPLLIIYLISIEFHVSATRSLIFLILAYLNKIIFNKKINNIALLAITGLIMVFYNPFIMFSYSFILSFLITLSIFITIFVLTKQGYFVKTIAVFLVAHIYSTLIIHTFNKNYNIFSFFIQLLFIPIISLNYIITLLFFRINIIIENTILWFDAFIDIISESNIIIKFDTSWLMCFIFSIALLKAYKIKLHSQLRLGVW
ncbi:MAG0480 family ComEC-like protein [Mycoplasma sp. 125]|uniref:MAG0480 family ComEC-like protein n=1 Tax=Mycoplasma sp. 125 TaxID=3447505 RepID=UPI003F65B4C6